MGKKNIIVVQTGDELPSRHLNGQIARRAGAQKVEYRFTNGVIERVAYPMLDGSEPLAPAAMVDNVSAVKLRYRINGAWSDRWAGSPRAPLPQVLEMRLVRGNGTEFRQLFVVGSGYVPQAMETPSVAP